MSLWKRLMDAGAGIPGRGCCCVCRLHVFSLRALIHILSAEAVKDPFKMLRAWFTISLSNFFHVNFFFFPFNLLSCTSTVRSRRTTKIGRGIQEFVSFGQVKITQRAVGRQQHCGDNHQISQCTKPVVKLRFWQTIFLLLTVNLWWI